MKKVLFLLIASFLIIGCEKDNKNNNEEQPPRDEPKDLSDINSYVGEWKLTKVIQGYVFENGKGKIQIYNGLPYPSPYYEIPSTAKIETNEKMTVTVFYPNDFTVTSEPSDLDKIAINEEKINILQQINNTGLVTLNIPNIGDKMYNDDRGENQEDRDTWCIANYVSSKSLVFVGYSDYSEDQTNSDPEDDEKTIFSFTVTHYTR